MRSSKVTATILVLLNALSLNGQTTIWEEDFDSYSDFTQAATDKWTFNCNDCTGPRGVVSGEIVATGDRKFGNPDITDVTWSMTPAIDISGFTDVSLSIDVAESGAWEPENFLVVEYILDGSSTITVESLADDFGSLTIAETGINGSTLRMRVRAFLGEDESISLDNVIISGNIILPVELVSFSAESNQTGNLLRWATASEINNSHFEIERSQDGQSFTKIGTVAGQGHSNELMQYTYYDKSAFPASYYRLKQVDFNGQFEYSSIRMAQGPQSTSIYPNPVGDQLNVALRNPSVITISAMYGKALFHKSLEKGIHRLHILLPDGLLHVEITSENTHELVPIIKK